MMKVAEMMEQQKTVTLAWHGKAIDVTTALVHLLPDKGCLQRGRRNVVTGKVEIARLMAADRSELDDSAVLEQLKKDVLTITMKGIEQIGTPSASLEQSKKEVGELKKIRDAPLKS